MIPKKLRLKQNSPDTNSMILNDLTFSNWLRSSDLQVNNIFTVLTHLTTSFLHLGKIFLYSLL